MSGGRSLEHPEIPVDRLAIATQFLRGSADRNLAPFIQHPRQAVLSRQRVTPSHGDVDSPDQALTKISRQPVTGQSLASPRLKPPRSSRRRHGERTFVVERQSHPTYALGMRALQATALRKGLYEVLDQIEATRSPVEILRHGRPVAVLAPSARGPASRRKPVIDLNSIEAFCKRHKVKAFSLFGSILREDFDGDSDVDVLVHIDGRRPGFHRTCAMLDDLEAMFGRTVDMITKQALDSPAMNVHRRTSITSSARLVYQRD